jgi:hypothetical protein
LAHSTPLPYQTRELSWEILGWQQILYRLPTKDVVFFRTLAIIFVISTSECIVADIRLDEFRKKNFRISPYPTSTFGIFEKHFLDNLSDLETLLDSEFNVDSE